MWEILQSMKMPVSGKWNKKYTTQPNIVVKSPTHNTSFEGLSVPSKYVRHIRIIHPCHY